MVPFLNGPISPEERIEVLFTRLRHVFPFDSAMVAASQPDQVTQVPVVNRGYDIRVVDHLTNEFLRHDPTFHLQSSNRSMVFHWANIPGFKSTQLAEDVLMPAGYREGTSIVLEDGSGAMVGTLHVSMVSPELPEQLIDVMPTLRRGLAEILTARRVHSNLTVRELEILSHVASGLSNAEIAERLFLGPGTVRTHVENILRKVGARNRTQASLRVFGLIGPFTSEASVTHGDVGLV